MVKAGRVAIVPKGEFAEGLQYTRLDLVTYQDNAYIAKKDNADVLPTDTDCWMHVMDFSGVGIATTEKAGTVKPDGITVKIAEDGTISVDNPEIDIDGQTPTFEEAGNRENIESGESVSILFGKIKKWFSDVKAVAFTGNYDDLENRVRVKGNSESDYRTGDVNLTPADIGAVNKAGDEMTGSLAAAGFGLDSDIHNQMQVSAHLGEASDETGRIFLQEDLDNAVVNIGIVGKGAVGVNKAKDADTVGGKQISELVGSTLTGTLSAGETTISFTDPVITQESMIDIYTDVYGVNPTMVDYAQENATLTLTFDAQKMDLGVKMRVI